MRRSRAASLAALSLVAALLAAAPSSADADAVAGVPVVAGPAVAEEPDREVSPAQRALSLAEDSLEGGTATGDRPEATLALRDLFASLPRLRATERRRAEALLARPTQRARDPYGDGYRARSVRTCAKRVCVHRVKRTSDRASAGWARRTLKVMSQVWRKEVARLGYRRPLADRRRGGNKLFDVYLADVGSDGLYGYCAPELTKKGNRRLASGYCVLDNDFARSQFRARPAATLRVTAAHEFFHAVQFAYDYLEDPWLMEATATWVEERFADGVDDNRQYLRFGQVRRTRQPLDLWTPQGAGQYGNWAFFEFLSGRFGSRVVRRTWQQAGEAAGDGNRYSTRALVAALPPRQSFPAVYAAFTAANTTPGHSYPEGEHWPGPRLAPGASVSLGRDDGATRTVRIDHLAGHDFRLRPGAALDTRAWRLRVEVDAPGGLSSPVATVVRLTAAGGVERISLELDDSGVGELSVPFNQVQTEEVWVAVANASTRFACRGRYVLGVSCGGTARDDGREFLVSFESFQEG